jgi:hypothetical protein
VHAFNLYFNQEFADTSSGTHEAHEGRENARDVA